MASTSDQVFHIREFDGVDRRTGARVNRPGSFYTLQNVWIPEPDRLEQRPGCVSWCHDMCSGHLDLSAGASDLINDNVNPWRTKMNPATSSIANHGATLGANTTPTVNRWGKVAGSATVGTDKIPLPYGTVLWALNF